MAASAGTLVLSAMVLARMAGLLEQVQTQAVQLSALAGKDGLTGIADRRTWDLDLSRACASARESGRPLSAALIDLDHCKQLNDAHGHQAGDRLLQEATAAWTAGLAGSGELYRYGGEEFAVLLPGLDLGAARPVVERLRHCVPSQQTISGGLASWDPATAPAEVLGAADVALYEAKRSGRGRVLPCEQAQVPPQRAAPGCEEQLRTVS